MSDTKERLLKIAASEFGNDLAQRFGDGEALFSSHNDRGKEPELDSLDRVEFALAVEEEFKMEIPDSILGGFSTVGDFTGYIDQMTAPPAHGGH
jgi:acyl carrier protein